MQEGTEVSDYAWYLSQLKWHSKRGQYPWHLRQVRWYRGQCKRTATVSKMLAVTLSSKARQRRIAANIERTNELLARLRTMK